MHIRTKFDGGRQINQSQRGSWQGRCAGAAQRMNEGPEWGPQQWAKKKWAAYLSLSKQM